MTSTAKEAELSQTGIENSSGGGDVYNPAAQNSSEVSVAMDEEEL